MIEVARTSLGRIALDPKALSSLVREAAEGAGARVGALDVSLEDSGAATVAVTLKATRRAVLPELGALVQQRTDEALQQALETPPTRVDVTIDGIYVEDDG